MPSDEQDKAGVVAPPPLIYVGSLVLGLLLNRRFPMPFLPRRIARSLGWPLLDVGVLLVGWFEWAMRQARTPTNTESGCILPGMNEKIDSERSESSRLEALYRKATDPVLRTHLLMVWRISLGDSVGEVARMVGYSKKWTKEIAHRYESEGVQGLGDRRHSNPGAKERALLDEEGQGRLREALLKEAPPGGGMWSGPKVARWIEEETGMERVHVQRGWEYLKKVGMSPQVPRPSNAQGADASEREAFKKDSPNG